MTETLATFTNQGMPTIIPDKGIERLKMDLKMTYIEKRSIDETIRQKLRKKDVYKT